jgi:hypothetical protein
MNKGQIIIQLNYLCITKNCKTMLKTIIIATVLLFIGVLLMGIRVFFSRKGTFPNTHISGNKAMQERGISCATSQEKELHRHISPIEEMIKQDNF